MGTRADFYVGRGEQAEWLGSIAYNGFPRAKGSRVPDTILDSGTEADYRRAVAEFLAGREDSTLPDEGWPWPWKNSRSTDFSYAYEADQVWVSLFGGPWSKPEEKSIGPAPFEGDPCDDGTREVFPDMRARKQRERFGPHSGVALFRSPKS